MPDHRGLEAGALARQAWAGALERDVVALWLAARDPRVPWHAKAVPAAVAAYALSPIDLIPDFVPILGYLDDLLIVPLGIMLAVKLIPPAVMAELRAQAAGGRKPKSMAGLSAVVGIWIVVPAVGLWAAGRYASGHNGADPPGSSRSCSRQRARFGVHA